MKKLGIIVTHYDEEWEVGKKFFDMLALQRDVDFREIHVTLIHDGTEEFPVEAFDIYPYTVEQVRIEHGGISRARNKGIELAEEPWICFCDFDDLFSGAYSLRHILSVLPTEKYDILWSEFYSEDMLKGGEMKLHRRGQNSVFIHAKFFRREFLTWNHLTFPEDLEFNEDSAFCAVAFAVCDYHRVGQITAEAPLYIWTFRHGSLTATQGNRWKTYKGLYYRNKKVVDAFRQYLDPGRYRTMVCRACYDAYFMLNVQELPEELAETLDDFKAFWKEHKADFVACDAGNRKEALEASRKEHEIGDREEEARWGVTELAIRKDVSFRDWIKTIETE